MSKFNLSTPISTKNLTWIACVLILFGIYFYSCLVSQPANRPIRTIESEIAYSQEPNAKPGHLSYSARIALISFDMLHYGYVFQIQDHKNGQLTCELIKPLAAPIRASEEDFNEMIAHNYLEITNLQQLNTNSYIYYYRLSPRGIELALNHINTSEGP